MLYIGDKNLVEQYRNSDRLNQSTLKELEDGLDSFLEKLDKDEANKDKPIKPHFVLGGAVDTILTGFIEDYNKDYFVSSAITPTESVLNVVLEMFSLIKNDVTYKDYENDENIKDELILTACAITNYNKNYKPETKIKNIREKGLSYLSNLIASEGKIVISPSQETIINNIVDSLRSNERTAKYFDREFASSQMDVDFYYQLPIYFTYKGVECKALLDLVIVEKVNGKVVSVFPIDLKTRLGFTFNFPISVSQRRYDLQGAWYREALLTEGATSPLPFPFEEVNLDIMKDFMFIVESTTNVGKPLIFKTTEGLLDVGKFGDFNPYSNKWIKKGFDMLIDDYIYYQNSDWKEERVVSRNNGVLTLGVNGIEE